MPQYVCLDFNTFVCTSCSGIQYVRSLISIYLAVYCMYCVD